MITQAANKENFASIPPETHASVVRELQNSLAHMEEYVRNEVSARGDWLKSILDGDSKDINAEAGYPNPITIEHYWQMFEREGIATRLVSMWPDFCWEDDPDIKENDKKRQTKFEKQIIELEEEHDIFHYMHRVDIASGIGSFGCLMFHLNDVLDPAQPVSGVTKDGDFSKVQEGLELTEITVHSEYEIRIGKYVRERGQRYGKPETYILKQYSPNQPVSSHNSNPNYEEIEIHWTRIIHVADNQVTSNLFGRPRMKNTYNRCYDIRKVLSGSGEMFWKGGFPGLSFEAHPDIVDAAQLNRKEIHKEFAAYFKELQRSLALMGGKVKVLSPNIADPDSHFMVQIKAIAATEGVPYRILLGSEAAQLASNQDVRNLNKRTIRRQKRQVTKSIIKPTLRRLQDLKILVPAKFYAEFNDIETLTEEDQASVIQRKTEALVRYRSLGGYDVLPPVDYFTKVWGWSQQEAEELRTILEELKENKETVLIPVPPQRDNNMNSSRPDGKEQEGQDGSSGDSTS